MNLRTIILSLLMSTSWLSSLYGLTKSPLNESEPVLYYAESQTYDRDLGILILKGHVEFEHQGAVLEADYVTYNENTDIVTASGNVRIRQVGGEIDFAEYVELTGDLKEGIVLQIRSLLEDNSKMAAMEGRKFEDRQELDQAVYTPCELCGDKPPTWQINARRAVKDDVHKDIHFTDAQMRILDVPILYLPFATQPLERRSGFLIPEPGYSSDFGALIGTPYYWALSEDKDMTVTPVFFTRQNPLFLGQYRQAFGNGVFRADGAITDYRKTQKEKNQEKAGKFEIPKTRGYYFVDGKFNLSEIWRTEFSGGSVSDKTFFRKYKFSKWQNEPALTSKAIVEGFLNQRDYAAGKLYHFQGLQDLDRQSHIAAALPLLEYSAYSGVDPLGGRFTFDGNFLNIRRDSGINMQREIGEIGWRRPWIDPLGQVYSIFGSSRGDLYQVRNAHHFANKLEKHGIFEEKKGGARFFPQAGLDWRWPFISSCRKQNVVLQPVGQLIVAPDKAFGLEQHHVPDEDSTDFEFNDANLFSPDRFPGYDIIDTGSRGVYGGEILTTGDLFGDVEAFLGQSYSFSEPKRRDEFQGFGRRATDYVGRFEASPFDWLELNYRFRLDQKSLSPRVSEAGGSIGPAIAKLSGDYVFISRHAGTVDKKDFEQIYLKLTSQITKYWSLIGFLRNDLKRTIDGGGPLERGVGILYRDDCFGLGLTLKRQFYRDRDLTPATIIMGTLYLKNIGDFNYSFDPESGLFGENKSKEKEP